MFRSGEARKLLGCCLVGPVLIVAVALALGGWLVPTTKATGNCCQTFCQQHPTASNCTPPTLPNVSHSEKELFSIGVNLAMGFWDPHHGLGPVFTQAACVDCHAVPFAGGSGSDPSTQVTHFGKFNSDGTFNPLANEGGDQLHPNSIQGVFFAPSCKLPGEVVPSDATVVTKRETPPTLGNGLMDSIPDATIQQNATNQKNSQFDQQLGIHGQPNMVPDLNGNLRPGRFGWRAQQPTLLQFVAGAFQGELGITNSINPTEHLPQGKPIPTGCQVANSEPNDSTGNFTVNITQFELFIAPHTAATLDSHGQNGLALFKSIGCAECHVPSMQTAAQVFIPLSITSAGKIGKVSTTPSPSLSNQTANLYSDLLIHDMGAGLDGFIPQGQATRIQWRTPPLWGLSLKVFYLHDGRTADLTTAILAHGGEGAKVTEAFQGLTSQEQSDILTFLNAL